ncbi:hypothetical protein KDN34_14305 [Shewanella yunxiaonensis]|uniref:Uncharacterized protein n=1 Tax=Shewanella yunxiaonensis TaxID=2829809 RepID=A0ABX7YRF4_9GAMM|nr:hypothetical protein [Shewanella yunxiaonensis]QUN05355.1 hypothetical protein KDN34_14305 [Shewanella yunxiaonensis]
MRKITIKERERDVIRELRNRKNTIKKTLKFKVVKKEIKSYKNHNNMIDAYIKKGLVLNKRNKKNDIEIFLPESMDLNRNYHNTVVTLNAIRECTKLFEDFKNRKIPKSAYKLRHIRFENLKKISTSAALVLTAEISKWNSIIRARSRT